MTAATRRRRRTDLRHPMWAPIDRKWPSQPLIDHTGSRSDFEARMAEAGMHVCGNLPELIGDKAADRYACALGLHPALIWSDWFDVDLDPWDPPT